MPKSKHRKNHKKALAKSRWVDPKPVTLADLGITFQHSIDWESWGDGSHQEFYEPGALVEDRDPSQCQWIYVEPWPWTPPDSVYRQKVPLTQAMYMEPWPLA